MPRTVVISRLLPVWTHTAVLFFFSYFHLTGCIRYILNWSQRFLGHNNVGELCELRMCHLLRYYSSRYRVTCDAGNETTTYFDKCICLRGGTYIYIGRTQTGAYRKPLLGRFLKRDLFFIDPEYRKAIYTRGRFCSLYVVYKLRYQNGAGDITLPMYY